MATPRILHQTWKSRDLPERFRALREKWLALTPDYQHLLHTDDDNRELIAKHFPQYLEAYDDFGHFIERVDFARYAWLYVVGGVYADLDTFPNQNIDVWVEKNQIVLGQEPPEHSERLYESRPTVLCNAFMISPPRAPFWLELMDFIVTDYDELRDPVRNTGPMAMTILLEERPKVLKSAIITEACTFFPLLAKEEGLDENGNQRVTRGCDFDKETYVAHVWTNTWTGTNESDSTVKKIIRNVIQKLKSRRFWSRKLWIGILLLLFLTILWFCVVRSSAPKGRGKKG